MLRGLRPVLLVALLATSGVADSTVLVRRSLTELSQEAELIVYARVVGQHCAWNAKRSLIWTHTDLAIVECWKGNMSGKISLMEPGGRIPPMGQHVPGMARYQLNELAVIFLKKDVLGQWRTLGCAQGKLAIEPQLNGSSRLKATPWTKHVISESKAAKGKMSLRPTLAAFRKAVKILAVPSKLPRKGEKPSPRAERGEKGGKKGGR